MKKFERGALLFLALVLVLSIGISYLALHKTIKTGKDYDIEKMAVAIVNEDEGTSFQGNKYEFGSEFIKNIEKDDTYNWYVVSRGVAESGLNEDVYNLMIVIPNDFTQKALSMDSKVPEKVTLNYKINASGNNKIKEEAEKTVSSILGEFNRIIIDVYFASIIGNLQDAQENVTEIVNKEETYINTYNGAVNSRLSNYTVQFASLQNGVDNSQTSFSGFQDMLKDFESQQGDGVKANRDYYSGYQEYANKYLENRLVLQEFSKQLSQLDQDMNNSDVLQQLKNLESANKVINDQFQISSFNTANINADADGNGIATGNISVDGNADADGNTNADGNANADGNTNADGNANADGNTNADGNANADGNTDADGNANTDGNANADGNTNGDGNANVDGNANTDGNTNADGNSNANGNTNADGTANADGKGRTTGNTNANANVNSISVAIQSDLDKVLQEIEAVNKIFDDLRGKIQTDIQKNMDKGLNAKEISEKELVDKVNKIFQDRLQGQIDQLPTLNPDDIDQFHLKDTTANQIKNVIIVTNKYSNEFGYVPNRSTASNPLLEEVKGIKENGASIVDSVILPTNKMTGQELTLKVPDEFQIDQVLLTLPGMTENNYTETYKQNGKIVLPPTDEGQFTVKLKITLKDNNSRVDLFQPISWSWSMSQTNITNVDNPDVSTADEITSTENSVDGTVSEAEAVQTAPVEKVTMINNNSTHQVLSPLSSKSTGDLIEEVSDIVSSYKILLMLYDMYFGIDMSNPNLSKSNLAALAKPDSLYALLNNQDAAGVLGNFVLDEILDGTGGQSDGFQDRIQLLMQQVIKAKQNAGQFANIIYVTNEQAKVLNDNLNMTIAELANWREESLKLLNEQSNILEKIDEEQSAVVALDDNFNTLLATSESLAEQSTMNLSSADTVYGTLDGIKNEALSIQSSGDNLVKQANDLSANLINKLKKDKNFSDNFAEVLVNSRIGERPNENLYSFLSNPVQTKNDGTIAEADDTSIPYFLVLIIFIVAMFSAYVISNNERKRIQKDTFEEEKTMVWNNTPITIITASIGIVEGLVIGSLSGYLLQVDQEKFWLWIGLITLIMLTLLPVATYLLRQLKMIGMFTLLIIMSMYLFLTEAVGFQFDKLSPAAKIQEFSPLQYIENLLAGFLRGIETNWIIMISLLIIILISLVGNLFVVNRFSKNQEVEDEEIIEAH